MLTKSLPPIIDNTVPEYGDGTQLNAYELDTVRFQKLVQNDVFLKGEIEHSSSLVTAQEAELAASDAAQTSYESSISTAVIDVESVPTIASQVSVAVVASTAKIDALGVPTIDTSPETALYKRIDKVKDGKYSLTQAEKDAFVTVGTGGQYANIQAAFDAGKTSLQIVSDLVLAADAVIPRPTVPFSQKVMLISLDRKTITMQNGAQIVLEPKLPTGTPGIHKTDVTVVYQAYPAVMSTPDSGSKISSFISAGYRVWMKSASSDSSYYYPYTNNNSGVLVHSQTSETDFIPISQEAVARANPYSMEFRLRINPQSALATYAKYSNNYHQTPGWNYLKLGISPINGRTPDATSAILASDKLGIVTERGGLIKISSVTDAASGTYQDKGTVLMMESWAKRHKYTEASFIYFVPYVDKMLIADLDIIADGKSPIFVGGDVAVVDALFINTGFYDTQQNTTPTYGGLGDVWTYSECVVDEHYTGIRGNSASVAVNCSLPWNTDGFHGRCTGCKFGGGDSTSIIGRRWKSFVRAENCWYGGISPVVSDSGTYLRGVTPDGEASVRGYGTKDVRMSLGDNGVDSEGSPVVSTNANQRTLSLGADGTILYTTRTDFRNGSILLKNSYGPGTNFYFWKEDSSDIELRANWMYWDKSSTLYEYPRQGQSFFVVLAPTSTYGCVVNYGSSSPLRTVSMTPGQVAEFVFVVDSATSTAADGYGKWALRALYTPTWGN